MRDVGAMPVMIRPAEAADVPAMAAIRAREWESQEYWERRIGGYLAGNLGAQHSLPGHAVFVAVEDGAVVGFVAGHHTTRHGCDGELEWIDVVAEYRRRGIAGKLIVEMAGWFIGEKISRVCIDVQPKNLVARALYAKFGAQPLNPHWLFWEDIHAAVAAANRPPAPK